MSQGNQIIILNYADTVIVCDKNDGAIRINCDGHFVIDYDRLTNRVSDALKRRREHGGI